MRQDSIAVHSNSGSGDSVKTAATAHHELTPKEVLSWLPADATPAQQDSAIQRHIKISEIHWSQQPDTLHMPGHPKGKSIYDISLPQYYRESFFSEKPYFHPEVSGGRQGVAGDPVPYTVAGDNLFTALLLGCFVLTVIAVARLREFIVRQTRSFFRVQRGNTTEFSETSNELWVQLFLIVQTCLLASLCYFLYTCMDAHDAFLFEQPVIIGIFAAIFLVYFLLKFVLYESVGWVFFDVKKNEQWGKSYLLLISFLGLLLFPLVLLLTYFDLSTESAVIYVIAVVVFVKILAFYRTYIIFFTQKGSYLKYILYFCALEIVPLCALWGILTVASQYLKVNF